MNFKSLILMLLLVSARLELFSQCFSLPTYCTPTITNVNSYSIGLQNVTLGSTINNSSVATGLAPNYYDYSNLSVAGAPGATINFSVTNGGGNTTGARIFIDYNQDGTYSTSSPELVWTSGTTTANAVVSGSFVIPTGQSVGAYRVRVTGDLGGQGANPCNLGYGEVEDYTLVVTSSTTDGLAMNQTSPSKFVLGNNVIGFNIANLTNSSMTSVNIGYKLGSNSPVTQSLSGLSVPAGGVYNAIFSTQLNISSAGSYSIKIWLNNVNGSGNVTLNNDTICKTFVVCPGLNGTYTINPSGSGSTNFKRFGLADTALINCGVSGPVVFNVATGTYNEQVILPSSITGLSATNSVTFQSASSIPANVVINFSATSSANNATVKLDGVSYIKFKNLTITAAGSSYGTALYFNTNSSNDSFFNVVFNGNTTSSSTSNMALISCQNNAAFHFTYFGNCKMNNGAYGTYLISNSTNILGTATQNLTFFNCDFKNQYAYGMYHQYFDGIRLINNRITTNSTYTSYTGMYNYWIMILDDTKRPIITGNSITGGTGGTGMYHQYFGVNSTVSTIRRGIIANNMVQIGSGSNTTVGLRDNNDYGSDYVHNSVNNGTSDNTLNSAAAFFEAVASNTVAISNNIFSGYNGAAALRTGTITNFTPCNFNDLYSIGTNLAYYSNNTGYTNLAAWRSISGRDANSVSVSPGFTSSTDLHITSTNLLTVPVHPLVLTDYDNQTRCSITDIGADYHPSNNDIGVSRTIHPNNGIAGSGTRDVIVLIKNYGSNTVTSANVSYTDNSITRTVAWTGSIGPCDSAVVTFTGSNQYTFSGAWALKFFTDGPNGSSDAYLLNDTIKSSGCVGLAGNYTIDPSGSGSTNFTTFTAAVNAMLSCGIATPIVFSVKAATYSEQVNIPNINGTSTINTITFDGGNGNASTRILTASTTSGTQHIVRFNDCRNVIFRNMTLRSTGTTDAWVAHFMNGANNRVNNCIIEITGTGATATGSNLIPVLINGSLTSSTTASSTSNNHTVDSCTINAGYYNICVSINASANTLNIRQNKLYEAYQYGFYALNPFSLRLRGNSVTMRTAVTSNVPIYLQSVNNTGSSYFEISGNKVLNPGQMGIYLNSCSNSGSEFNQVFNNMIGGNFRYAPATYGIYLTSCTRTRVYHNSVNLDIATTGVSAAVYVTNGSLNDVRNNSLAVTNTASVSAFNLYITPSTAVSNVDYNNYFNRSTSSLVYIGGPSFESYNFRGAYPNGGGLNSISTNPGYVSNSDLHTTAACNNAASVGITVDIDGQARASLPDMGADEASNLPNNDIGVSDILNPVYPMSPGSKNIKAVIRNYGNNTVTSANVIYRVNGGSGISQGWTGSLNTCDTAHVTFTTPYNFTNGASSIVVYTNSPNSSTDTRLSNDTFKMTLCTAMSGVYTIDPNGSGSTNFISFKQAVDALSCGGITGPVKLIVAAGTYSEQVSIPPIQGSSALNTIIFEGVNKSNRILTFPTTATALYVVQMKSCNYVTFRNLTIRSTGTTAGWVAHFMDGYFNRLNNCIVEITGTGASYTGSNLLPVVVNGSPSTMSTQSFTSNNNMIDSCVINAGYYNIYVAISAVDYKFFVKDNILNSAYQYSYFSNGNYAPKIIRNTINLRTAITSNYGIYMQNCNNTQGNSIEISGNKITNAGIYGIFLTSCSKSGSDFNQVNNNMVGNFRYNNGAVGIYLSSVNKTQVFHNSVDLNIATLSTGTNAALFIQSGSGNEVKNNHLAVTHTAALNAYPLWLSATSVAGAVDYNNYFNLSSPYLMIFGTTLFSPKNFNQAFPTGGGIKSINLNPYFISTTDLHSSNTCNAGQDLTLQVPLDIDGNTRSSTPDIGADEVTSTQNNDIGVLKINSPNLPLNNGINTINVTLRNYGANNVTSATIAYRLNGGAPVTQSWSGNLAPCDTVNFVFTTTVKITGATSLKVYTSSPNSGTDPINKNDTAQYSICASLNGIYTIGTSGNFPNFTAAVNALICGGVSGPVTFNVASGSYYEQVNISDLISGISSGRQITFKSASGNPDDVNLGFGGTSSNNYTVALSNAKYVKFRNMTITALNSSFGTALSINTNSSYDSFTNVIFNGISTTTNTTNLAVISSLSGISNFIYFDGCKINNGAYGSYFNSNGTIPSSENLTFNKCVFTNQYVYGIYNQNLTGLTLTKNTVITNSTFTTYTGIFNSTILIPADVNRPIITGNTINGAIAGTGLYNLNVGFNSTITTARRPLIANNMIQIGSTGTLSMGIRDGGSLGSDYIHNSVNIGSTLTTNTSAAGYFESTTAGNVILNNVFSGYAGAPAIRINTLTAYTTCNYNNLFTTGANLGYTSTTARTTLALWQSGAGKDANSISVNPIFTSNSNLHSNQVAMDNAGTASSLVLADYDGQARCPNSGCPGGGSAPDIGADEFIPVALDVTVVSVDAPTLICPNTVISNVLITIKNLGSTTLTSATIDWSINGTAQASYNWSGSLAQGASISSVNIGSSIFGGGTPRIKAWVSLVNGSADQNNMNDTTTYNVPSTLKGLYSIGGANPDFKTFTDAVNALNIRGICGPVVFNVRQGGYFERIQINAITGSSAVNFVTFRADPANTAPAEILIDGNSSATDNHTIFLNGTRFIAFRNLKITNKSIGTASFGSVVRFAGTQDSILFINNTITGPLTTNTSTNFAVINHGTGSTNMISRCVLDSNIINNGSYGIYMLGNTNSSASTFEFRNKIRFNQILGAYYRGIDCEYQRRNDIIGNKIWLSAASQTSSYGVYMIYNDSFRVERNSINNFGQYGIYMQAGNYQFGSGSYRSTLNNNMIGGKTTNTSANGIYLAASSPGTYYLDVFHNSVSVNSTNTGGAFFLQQTSTGQYQDIDIRNNSFANYGSGAYAAYFYFGTTTPITNLVINYNNYYVAGNTLIVEVSQSGYTVPTGGSPAFNANSIGGNPGYVNEKTNLHGARQQLNDKAPRIISCSFDFDGQGRPLPPATLVDIGADEYYPPVHDLSVTQFIAPDICNSPQAITVKVQNMTAKTIDSFRMNWKINGAVQTPVNVKTTLTGLNSVNVNLSSSYAFTSNTDYNLQFWSYRPNGVIDSVADNDTLNYLFSFLGNAPPPTAINSKQCGNGKAILTGIPAIPSDSISWYTAATGGTYLGLGNKITGPHITGTTTFYAQGIRLGKKTRIGSVGNTIVNSIQTVPYGGMLNLVVANTVLLDSMLFRFGYNLPVTEYNLYYKPGTFSGFETNPAAWTQINSGQVDFFVLNGINYGRVSTKGMFLQSGQTYSFYFASNVSNYTGNVMYSQSAGQTVNNSDMTVVGGGSIIIGAFGTTQVLANWHPEMTFIYKNQCSNGARAAMTVTVKPRPMAGIQAGSTFEGQFRAGDKFVPDVTEVGKTVIYELIPPTGYFNAGHGSTWSVNNLTVRTKNGVTVPVSQYTVDTPSASGPGKITFKPGSMLLDSLVTFVINFSDKGPNFCDSFLSRWVMVAPTPKTNFRFKDTLCLGESIVFENLTTIHSGNVTHTWYFGDGDSADVENPFHDYKTEGVYNVRLVSRSHPWGVIKDTTLTLEVSEIPVAKYKVTNKCEGLPVEFLNQSSINKGTLTYTWDFGDGSPKSTVLSPNHQYATVGGHRVTLTVTSSSGCASVLMKNAHQFARPVADFTAPSVPTCSRSEVGLTNTSTIALGSQGAYWTFGDGTGSTLTHAKHPYAAPGTYSIKLLAVSEFDCKDSITKSVVIKASPEPDFVGNQFCSRIPTTFTNKTVEALPNPVYQWTFSDNYTSSVKNVTRTWPHQGAYSATLSAAYTNGCQASVTKDFIVLIQPKAEFSVQNICSGETVGFVNNTLGEKGNIKYFWDFGNGTNSNLSSPVRLYNPASTTTYTVTLVSSYDAGCSDTIRKTITVTETPVCDFTIKNLGFLGYSFTPSITNYPSYEWFFGDGEASTSVSPVYNYKLVKYYNVTMKATNIGGCECLLTKKLIVNTDVNSLQKVPGINVYPNPNTGTFTVSNESNSGMQVEVYNLLGSRVYSQASEQGELVIDLDDAANGVYMVRITIDGVTHTTKITIVN